MIQGGDPDSKKAKPGEMLGNGGLGYTVPAEFNPLLFHKKGALAAARDENPAKASSSTQFYLVQGKTFTDDELNRIEQMRLQGKKIPQNQREVYKTLGGTPHLDQSYTVFGEVVRGIEQVEAIAVLKTDDISRPLADVSIKASLLKKREIKKLEKELIKESFKSKLIMGGKQ
jgi:peptidyl-prolyl cis-trans isomerase B (cyclophilin B)